MTPNQRRAGVSQHNVWIEDELWAAAQAKATAEGTTTTAIIRAALEQYVNHPK